MQEKELTHDESIRLINEMIGKAKNNVHDSGLGSIMWGIVIPVCALITFAQIKGWFRLPFDIWWLTLLAVGPQIYFSVREGKKLKVRSYDETALNYVWAIFGAGIFMLIFIHMQVLYAIQGLDDEYLKLTGKMPSFRFSEFSSSYFLLWYGMPGMITGGIKNFRPMLIGGGICWALAVVAAFTPVHVDMLCVALGAVCAWLIPGIILRKLFNEQVKQGNV
ncbi:MAG: hypothetical protein WAT19_07110 [Ferruginibacter sp.]